MKQEIIDLYDEYTHAPLDRRVFLQAINHSAQSNGLNIQQFRQTPLIDPLMSRKHRQNLPLRAGDADTARSLIKGTAK